MENQKINWKQKLTSRKMWAALVGIVAGLVTAAVSVVSYIFGESKVDAARQFGVDDGLTKEGKTETEV